MRGEYDFRCRFVSIHRPLDSLARARRFFDALRVALRSGADHLVISGDLTEMGTPSEFECFASVLHEAKVPHDAVTLVPGNHDAYTAADGWRRALEGPLRPYARGSALEAGRVVERGDVVLLPIDVTKHQTVARSSGELTATTVEALERRFVDRALRDKALVVVQHHPPFSNPRSPWHFIDGLAGYARMLGALAKHPRVQLLHGHNHRITDRAVRTQIDATDSTRVFSAAATVEDLIGKPRVRLYDVRDGKLEAVGLAA